ncbi:hypothetical protein AMIS_21520 [Actinoplanes missouriensis 431]|uniref:Uncharacterized protein n=1 Tax=Actinoplanes missouriensis (strain ATCC 14538 / DSM 43046 / CBS 188.64 / JCM 3121 / NBRC 102363 / NCIMB 12654 / NRRL B-3342 / UNCC 431) TaxID=512565 RepID=I0H2Y5_ACTM4|nr:hypothetical protein AMIS_21520 [Actinoplanes missouriensis 431]
MTVDTIRPPVVAGSKPGNTGTLAAPGCAYCSDPACPGTLDCYRDWAGSETGWREIALKRPRWVLANGQAVA